MSAGVQVVEGRAGPLVAAVRAGRAAEGPAAQPRPLRVLLGPGRLAVRTGQGTPPPFALLGRGYQASRAAASHALERDATVRWSLTQPQRTAPAIALVRVCC